MDTITIPVWHAAVLLGLVLLALICNLVLAAALAHLAWLLDGEALYVEPSAGENDVPAEALRGAVAPHYHQTAGNRRGKGAVESGHVLFHQEMRDAN